MIYCAIQTWELKNNFSDYFKLGLWMQNVFWQLDTLEWNLKTTEAEANFLVLFPLLKIDAEMSVLR